MKVFFLYDYFLPAFKAGGPIQSLQNLAYALKGHSELSIICSNKDADSRNLPVSVNKWTDLNGFRVFYATTGFLSYRRLVDSNALLFINGIFSLHFNLLPLLLLKGRKILSVRGMLHPQALGQKKTKKRMYLILLRFLVRNSKIEFHVTSSEEKSYVHNIFGVRQRVWLIPNLPTLFKIRPPLPLADKLILSTVALISPMKNHLLILEALKHSQTAIEYRIYGPVKDSDYWSKCLQMIHELPQHIEVKYFGEIQPAEVEARIAQTHVYIQPSLSENFGHSIVQALSAGRPVITSHATPWNHLKKNLAGVNVCINHAKEVTAAIEFFATLSDAQYQSWSYSARQYILSNLDIERTVNDYKTMFSLS